MILSCQLLYLVLFLCIKIHNELLICQSIAGAKASFAIHSSCEILLSRSFRRPRSEQAIKLAYLRCLIECKHCEFHMVMGYWFIIFCRSYQNCMQNRLPFLMIVLCWRPFQKYKCQILCSCVCKKSLVKTDLYWYKKHRYHSWTCTADIKREKRKSNVWHLKPSAGQKS